MDIQAVVRGGSCTTASIERVNRTLRANAPGLDRRLLPLM
jgi:hypothetical protein